MIIMLFDYNISIDIILIHPFQNNDIKDVMRL